MAFHPSCVLFTHIAFHYTRKNHYLNLSFLQIKAVYVKKLPNDVTQDQLRKLFERHGQITEVVLPPAKSEQEKSLGFVHFAERSALIAQYDAHVLSCAAVGEHNNHP